MGDGNGSERGALIALVGALGVVFGDIGTSPLYAMRTVLGESDRLDTTTVYGMTSTVIWSLLLVVTMLYVGLLLGADNEGEGGLLALLGLIRRTSARARVITATSVLAMIGASMFLGDCVVTPAISVLSAAEGLEVANPSMKAFVVPIALVILAGVFVLQRVGTGRIGAIYGPVMVLWFAVLAAGGAASLAQDPGALTALSPHWAVRFFLDDPLTAFLSLGSVILAVTGAEALYADLGHFGRAAITRAWLLVVLPALVLAYLGEASEVVRDPSAASQPFYAAVPGWATIPVLVLATLATIIASEAVIAGAFTVLHQAGGLGLFPYLRTRHPSPQAAGRIYLPAANWGLAAAVLLIVAMFRSSEKLAAAYGVAVAGTILVTSVLYLTLDRIRAGRTTVRQAGGALGFLVMLAFFVATLPKIASGGWAPVGIGLVLFLVMWTWWRGRRRLAAARQEAEGSPDEVLDEVAGSGSDLHRAPGTSVFLTEDDDVAPFALRTSVETTRTLPERVVLLSWRVEDTPTAKAHETNVTVHTFEDRYDGILGVSVVLGYRERLVAEHVLNEARRQEPDLLDDIDPDRATYLVSDPIPRLARDGEMAVWRQRLFLAVDRLATDRVEQLSLPRDRTIVIGREFDL
jgi:KUP system potassium uptake protein